MMKVPKILMVSWGDAWANSRDYFSPDELKNTFELLEHSVGFEIVNSKKGICLGSEYEPGGDRFRHVQFIPRKMIKKVFVIRKELK